jgi:hypothetical protein
VRFTSNNNCIFLAKITKDSNPLEVASFFHDLVNTRLAPIIQEIVFACTNLLKNPTAPKYPRNSI